MSAAAGLGRLADYRGARRADDGENYALPAAVIAAAAAADGGGGVGSGRGSRWNEESGERGHEMANATREDLRKTTHFLRMSQICSIRTCFTRKLALAANGNKS
jgi:hypothetical protein